MGESGQYKETDKALKSVTWQPGDEKGRVRPCEDPRLGVHNERIAPTKDLKEFRICPSTHQVTNIGFSLTE